MCQWEDGLLSQRKYTRSRTDGGQDSLGAEASLAEGSMALRWEPPPMPCAVEACMCAQAN